MHADGSLRVLGRLDDTLVLTNGENVNAPYLENELCASEWIEQRGGGRGGQALRGRLRRAEPRAPRGARARALGLTRTTWRRSSPDERVVKHYRHLANVISGDARRFAPYERVHRVRLWLEEFRIGRELSQTLKLRRHEFLRLYSGEIDELYSR